MVTPACYAASDARRSGGYRGPCPAATFGPFAERRFQMPSHAAHSHESRTSIMSDREDAEGNPTRKRIAVACGRCRKRKIRCSGDPGNGEKCHNCKNAGADACLFLRVSSTEAPLRHEHSDYYQNIPESQRYNAQTRTVNSPINTSSVASFPPEGLPIPASMAAGDVMGPYRGSAAGYYGGKYYPSAAASGWSGYSEDGADYSLPYGSYPYLNQDPGHMVPTSYRSSGKYMDTSPNYVYESQSGYNSSPTMVHRPAAASDSSNFSFSNVSAALPTQVSDRHLPTPGRTLPRGTSVLPYRESSSYSSAPPSSKAPSTATASSTSPTSPISDLPQVYSSYDASSITPYPSSTLPLPGRGAGAEVYSSSDSMYSTESTLRSQSSNNDIGSYTYSTPTDRRESYREGGASSSAHGSGYLMAAASGSVDEGSGTGTTQGTDGRRAAAASLRA